MNTERFNRTVDILVKAYLNDTLQHDNPCGCAVGNMIMASCGIKFKHGHDWFGDKRITWLDASPAWYKFIDSPTGIDQVASTGYSIDEILAIEKAFESANTTPCSDQDGYRGLCAVVDVLIDIDGIDLSVAEESKKLFVKP